MNWNATTAPRARHSKNLWHGSRIFLRFLKPFLFSVQGTNRHISNFTFLWPDIFVLTYHVVENHETIFGSDGNHLKKMELRWNLGSWLLILSAT